MGIEVKETEIFGSAYASAVYLSKVINFPKDKKVYVIGQEGLEEELDAVGVQHVGGSVGSLSLIGEQAGLTCTGPRGSFV